MERRSGKGARFGRTIGALLSAVAATEGVRAADIWLGERAEMPIVVVGAQLPALQSAREDRLAGFRWTGSAWQRIPLQVDPVYTTDLCVEIPTGDPTQPGEGWPPIPPGADPAVSCLEKRYDFTGTAEPDLLFDADDELAFLVRDAGARAPAGQADPDGSAKARTEIFLRDDVSGETGYVYLFAETSVPAPPGYAITATTTTGRLAADEPPPPPCDDPASNQYTTVVTDGMCLYWATRWSLDDLIPKPNPSDLCGATFTAGTAEDPRDLLDRWKGHEGDVGGGTNDDYWGCRSSFVGPQSGARPGEKTGPVRYLRGVIGAKSAVTTTVYTAVYPRYVSVETRLRVHPMAGIARLWDWSLETKGALTIAIDDSNATSSALSDPIDGDLQSGCGVTPGAFDGACVRRVDQRGEARPETWAMLAAPSSRRLFVYARTVSAPAAFTRDPVRDDAFKGFESFYGDHHGEGRAFDTTTGEEEDPGSLGNTGWRFDLRTPYESCRAMCPSVSDGVCRDGPSTVTDSGCSFGTYYQPFVTRDAWRVLPAAPTGENQLAAAARFARYERESPLVLDCGDIDLCNGLDDDCNPQTPDGSTDPALGAACDGADADRCAEGTATACVAGALVCSDASGDSPEICSDRVDGDCDGLTDEAPCASGASIADVNASGRVDGFDLAALARAFGAACGSPRYAASVDLDQSCLVDGDDLQILATWFGDDAP